MARGTFTTFLTWEQDGEEIEASVRVVYSYTKGYPASLVEPGEDASVEIISITPADPTLVVPERFDTDEDLLNECFADRADEEAEAAEWRSQCRRDDLLMERF